MPAIRPPVAPRGRHRARAWLLTVALPALLAEEPAAFGTRTTPSGPWDLEIRGIPDRAATSVWVTPDALATLEPEAREIRNDPLFIRTTRYRLLPVDRLRAALGIPADRDLVWAFTRDGRAVPITTEEVRQQGVGLAVEIDGRPAPDWPPGPRGEPLGPHALITTTYDPSRGEAIAGSVGDPRLAYGVTALGFGTTDADFRELRISEPTPTLESGQRLALRHCIACHPHGTTGGRRSAADWTRLAEAARRDPERFQTWIRAPRTLRPGIDKPSFADLPPQARDALAAYFRAFPATLPAHDATPGTEPGTSP